MLSAVTSGLAVHDVFGEIMTRLEMREWEVPGISVESTHVTEHENGWPIRRDFFRGVGGENFQANLAWGDGAPFLRRLVVPGIEAYFRVKYHELSMNMYAYNDWERDKEWFLRNEEKCHGQKYGAIRYLPYVSRCDCSDWAGATFESVGLLASFMTGSEPAAEDLLHTHEEDWRCPLMVHYDHYGTEYHPVGDEPLRYSTDTVLAVMRDWLTDNVLPML